MPARTKKPAAKRPAVCPWCSYPGHFGNCIAELRKFAALIEADRARNGLQPRQLLAVDDDTVYIR
jgi:hypothetical protein